MELTIELDREQVEKGLDRAARRLSQKYAIPGFRKGKAPRFIVENYFGRPALLEEASDDLINKAFREALTEEKIEPIGPASMEDMQMTDEPFQFTVVVPVDPTVTIPDHRAIRAPIDIKPIEDADVEQALEARRERHVVLREPEEERPAQRGDQVTAELEAFVDGEPVEERNPETPIQPSTLVLEPDRLAPGLFEHLVGMSPSQAAEIHSQMPEDHPNEKVAGKEVVFATRIIRIQERLLPEWDELPTLEEFDGTIEELREKTRAELIENARLNAEAETINSYIDQLVEQTEYDVPDVLIEQEADRILHQREHEYERYGVKPEQVYQMQGRKREDLVAELLPEGEKRLRISLALRELVRAEELTVEDTDIDAEVERILEGYEAEQRDRIRTLLSGQLRISMANEALDRKLRARILEIATGGTYTPPAPAAPAAASTAGDADSADAEAEAPAEAADDRPA
jgi:trigger factor